MPGNRKDVCELALLDAPNGVLPPVIQHVGCVHIRGLKRLRGCKAPFGVVSKLIRLLAVRNRRRRCAASKDDGNAGSDGSSESLLGKLEPAVASAGVAQVGL